jgi:NADH:ubiquinone oxidoreductase subunit F (NADH-binding)/NADH:ubiquinone oxidoreductase subunit E
MTVAESARVNEIIEAAGAKRTQLVGILHDLQGEFGYLPSHALAQISERLEIPLQQIYGVATFYKAFSLRPKGRHGIHVCLGTACHVLGAANILDRFSRELGIGPGETTSDMMFSLESVRCVGACSLAPVVVIGSQTRGRVRQDEVPGLIARFRKAGAQERGSRSTEHGARSTESRVERRGSGRSSRAAKRKIRTREDLDKIARVGCSTLWPEKLKVQVSTATCGLSAGAKEVLEAVRHCKSENAVEISVATTGCLGWCQREPIIALQAPHGPRVIYGDVGPEDVAKIVESHIAGQFYGDKLLGVEATAGESQGAPAFSDNEFYKPQVRIALRNCGLIDPDSIEEYIARGGYRSLHRVVTEMRPEEVIDEVKRSGLRGRGGGGFPTGRKWESCRSAQPEPKYVICNADEGDPGAYMDRSLLEGDPHSVLEGMLIGAYAIGSAQGYVYIRNEYPIALQMMRRAVEQAREYGLLGDGIFGTDFSFDIEINRGGGAFVCGESTALMASLEGKIGEPRAKYIHTIESGLWEKPSNLNNVETWANVPVIVGKGADWFASIGTQGSKGTKVFSLVGAVKNTGLVEVPMGTTLREMVFSIGGGVRGDGEFKAVQTGGPSGGFLPESLLDLPVDFDELTSAGSMMGSGGMIVCDSRTCMVDVARYFMSFLCEESCGKCVPCREGLRNMLDVLERITQGRGRDGDIGLLEELSHWVIDSSLCQLGGSAPNPVLSAITHFRDEYTAHIQDKRCPAGVCRALVRYTIDPGNCNGCHLCLRECPTGAISGKPKEPHTIDERKCTKCSACYDICKFGAVVRE